MCQANKWLNFGGDPITDLDPDLYHDTGKTYLDRGMNYPSASSLYIHSEP